MDSKLRRWELALMLGVALALILGAWLGGEQRSLADQVVRLHVIANSDSAEDQALKLAVRDGVLSRAEALYPPNATLDQARAALAGHLDELAAAGQAVVDAHGGTDRVTAQLTRCWFPTKTYDGFALPAGEYEALRVVIGEGGGGNWWCVVFPPLCLGSVTETTEEAAALGDLSESDVALIKQLPEGADAKELQKIAKQISAAVTKELGVKVVIGIGTVVNHIRDLARAYKEAGVAIDVGKVFETEKTVINYENLGIGRLIYQLPTILCQMFLQEVFKKNPIDALDQETLLTINKFFENNLNVSETARKLFVHRNTLVYRLEKIKKLTGLDLREFDDAITFKVALMVKKYLISRGIES